MRPICVCLAATFVAITLAGCSSTRSNSLPFNRSAGVASTAEGHSEYDRNPPPPRMASEPSPVPPARGISLTREIEATPTGFRRARHFSGCGDVGCGDNNCTTQILQPECAAPACAAPATGCVEEAPCVQDGCGTDSCGTCVGGCNGRLRLYCLRFLRPRNWCCFKCPQTTTYGEVECAEDTCAETACGTCAVPGDYCTPEGQACHQQQAQSPLAPPMGEHTHPYEGPATSGHSLQNVQPVPEGPGLVPDIPVDPIARQRFLEPPAWTQQPLTQSVPGAVNQNQPSSQPNELPAWSRSQRQQQPTLTPSATILRSPSTKDHTNGIQIQPLIRVSNEEPVNQ